MGRLAAAKNPWRKRVPAGHETYKMRATWYGAAKQNGRVSQISVQLRMLTVPLHADVLALGAALELDVDVVDLGEAARARRGVEAGQKAAQKTHRGEEGAGVRCHEGELGRVVSGGDDVGSARRAAGMWAARSERGRGDRIVGSSGADARADPMRWWGRECALSLLTLSTGWRRFF